MRGTTATLSRSVPAVVKTCATASRGNGSRFGSCAKSGEEMTATSTWTSNISLLTLVDCRDLWWRRDAQALDVRTFSTRREAWTGNANSVMERRLISHLSNTASVDAHCNLKIRRLGRRKLWVVVG
jgi:hypothetical protein